MCTLKLKQFDMFSAFSITLFSPDSPAHLQYKPHLTKPICKYCLTHICRNCLRKPGLCVDTSTDLPCTTMEWLVSPTKWMTVLGQWSHQSSFTVNHEMRRFHLRLRKPRKLVTLCSSAADYWLYILQTCFTSKWVTLVRCQSSVAATSLYMQEFLLSPSSSFLIPFFPLPPPSFLFPLLSDRCLCLWWCAQSCQSKFFFCGRNPERSFQKAWLKCLSPLFPADE